MERQRKNADGSVSIMGVSKWKRKQGDSMIGGTKIRKGRFGGVRIAVDAVIITLGVLFLFVPGCSFMKSGPDSPEKILSISVLQGGVSFGCFKGVKKKPEITADLTLALDSASEVLKKDGDFQKVKDAILSAIKDDEIALLVAPQLDAINEYIKTKGTVEDIQGMGLEYGKAVINGCRDGVARAVKP